MVSGKSYSNALRLPHSVHGCNRVHNGIADKQPSGLMRSIQPGAGLSETGFVVCGVWMSQKKPLIGVGKRKQAGTSRESVASVETLESISSVDRKIIN